MELINLTKKFHGQLLFHPITHQFADRGISLITGPSGSGKTSLLNLLAGNDLDYEGSLIFKQDWQKQTVKQRQQNQQLIRFIPQEPIFLLSATVYENLSLAAWNQQEQNSMDTLLAEFDLSELKHQKMLDLSGGQKQRIAVIRALLPQPALILADEPTSALDDKNAQLVMKMLQEVAQQRKVILVSHDLAVADYADEILALENKQLVIKKRQNLAAGPNQVATPLPTKLTFLKRITTAGLILRRNSVRYLLFALFILFVSLLLPVSSLLQQYNQQTIQAFAQEHQELKVLFLTGNEQDFIQLKKELPADTQIEPRFHHQDVVLTYQDSTAKIMVKEPANLAKTKLVYGNFPKKKNEIALSVSLARHFTKKLETLLGQSLTYRENGQTLEMKITGITNQSFDDYLLGNEQAFETNELKGVNVIADNLEDVAKLDQLLANRPHSSSLNELTVFLTSTQRLTWLFLAVALLLLLGGLAGLLVISKRLLQQRRKISQLLRIVGFSWQEDQQVFAGELVVVLGFILLGEIACYGLLRSFTPLPLHPFATFAVPILISLVLLVWQGIDHNRYRIKITKNFPSNGERR